MLFVDLPKANSFYRDGSGVGTLIEKLLFVDLSKANSFYRDGSGVGTLIEKLLFVDLSKAKAFYRDGPVSGWGRHIALETAFCRFVKGQGIL